MSAQLELLAETPERTEHPHIVRLRGIGGGEPTIKGTRIAVRLIAEYYKAGLTVEEIQRDYPHLNAAAIYDAISFSIDHQAEIEALIQENQIETVLDNSNLSLRSDGVIRVVQAQQKE